ncbi:MAG TPA: hypothetical protein VM103_00470 [Candidatus Paceibacterota bacterium]|nr:hypothetical protein [Candidatus Paceibacterota bacterium]
MSIQVFTEEPPSFFSESTKGSCFLEIERGKRRKILLMHRLRHKGAGDQWCTPARKVSKGESIRPALEHKVADILGSKEGSVRIERVRTVYVVSTSLGCFEHKLYRLRLRRQVIQNPDYQAYEWVTPRQALSKNLVDELAECIKIFYKLS